MRVSLVGVRLRALNPNTVYVRHVCCMMIDKGLTFLHWALLTTELHCFSDRHTAHQHIASVIATRQGSVKTLDHLHDFRVSRGKEQIRD